MSVAKRLFAGSSEPPYNYWENWDGTQDGADDELYRGGFQVAKGSAGGMALADHEDDKVLFLYGWTSGFITASFLDVGTSGTTIAEEDVAGDLWGSYTGAFPFHMRAQKISADKWLVTWFYNALQHVAVLEWTGSAFTDNTPITITASSRVIDMIPWGSEWILFYYDGARKLALISVSGTTPTVEDTLQVSITTTQTLHDYGVGVAVVDSTEVIASFANDDESWITIVVRDGLSLDSLGATFDLDSPALGGGAGGRIVVSGDGTWFVASKAYRLNNYSDHHIATLAYDGADITELENQSDRRTVNYVNQQQRIVQLHAQYVMVMRLSGTEQGTSEMYSGSAAGDDLTEENTETFDMRAKASDNLMLPGNDRLIEVWYDVQNIFYVVVMARIRVGE